MQNSNELTARWAAEAARDGVSMVLSGAAVWPLLAYLASAADGQAQQELTQAVGLVGTGAADGAAALISELLRSPAIHAALGIWVAAEVELTDWWLATVPTDTIGHLTRNPRVDQAAVDQWVRERSDGILDGMPGALSVESLMILAAAISVRTKWLEPFEGGMLMPPNGAWARRRIASLHRSKLDRDELRVLTTPQGKVTLLAVDGEDDIVVELATGEEESSAAGVLVAALTSDAYPYVTGSPLAEGDEAPGVRVGISTFIEEPRLFTTVPRFTIQSTHDLLCHGSLFGLDAVTDGTHGHFPRMSAYPLAVQSAHQGIAASFTETGFEAAAVTSVDFLAGGVPPARPQSIHVLFDRPFAFVARLRSSGLVLVAGWVADAEDVQWPQREVVSAPQKPK